MQVAVPPCGRDPFSIPGTEAPMLKIRCPDCAKEFLWTDDMPLRDRCPNPDCEGTYDVHEALKLNIAARTTPVEEGPACPACGRPVLRRWALCGHCGRIVAGSRTFRKRDFLLLFVLILLLLSVLVRWGLLSFC